MVASDDYGNIYVVVSDMIDNVAGAQADLVATDVVDLGAVADIRGVIVWHSKKRGFGSRVGDLLV